MIITIHQPEHMPWLGFFNKAINCDVFVLLDTVQYEKNYFQNRNQIISNNNKREWLTVPIKKGKLKDLICDKQIDFNNKTKNKSKNKYLQQIHRAYNSYPFYSGIMSDIKSIINDDNVSISKLNIKLIKYFFRLLDIKCQLIISSDLQLKSCASGGIIIYTICKKLKATTYLSGISGKHYLDEKKFLDNNILVEYQDFTHPEYFQPRDEFVPNLSILDLVFSLKGEESFGIIKEGYELDRNRDARNR